MKLTWRCAMIVSVLVSCVGVANGYMVRSALSLEKLTEESDIIFKGTVITSGPAQDEWFKPVQGFAVRETQFKVVSLIKGAEPGDRVAFRHYEEDPKRTGVCFMPQYYHFGVGRTYIVFAKKDDAGGGFRQLWMNHTLKSDQGVLLCADDKPVTAKIVKDVLWTELTAMLKSAANSDVLYAIGQLDKMSASAATYDGLSDFDRKDVVVVVRGMMSNRDPKIAQAAIVVVGSHNPYMSEERALFWLATVGSGEMPGLGKMDAKMKNAGGESCWKDLVALVDGKAPDKTRALAIRALGLVRQPALKEPVERWLKDREPGVRASATLLLADFPGPEAVKRLPAMAEDPAPEVRVCAARAVGFGQYADMTDVLTKLLGDKERDVREAAAMSLLSFSPKNEAIARLFQANLANEEFKPLFLVALARVDPKDYLDALAQVVEENVEPKNFWGGQMPAFTAWNILFKYLQAQPAANVRSGKLDHYLDAMEKARNSSSSEPRDVYAFYLQRGMNERARKFREAAKKTATYDIDYYFKQVDENPAAYKRN